MANNYLNSNKIKMFPSAYRSSQVDAESFFTTENNLTKTGTLGINKSFVEDDGTNLTIVIKGYRFEALKSDIVALFTTPTNVYANIKVVAKGSNNDFNTLVSYTDEDTGLDEEINSESKFVGICFSDTEQSGWLHILEKNEQNNYVVPKMSKIVLSANNISDTTHEKPIDEEFNTKEVNAVTGSIAGFTATTATIGTASISLLNATTATITTLNANAPTADKVNHAFKLNVNGATSTFNGSSTVTATVYANTTGGTSGYLSTSNGSGNAPTWTNPDNVIVGKAQALVTPTSTPGSYSLSNVGDDVNPVYFGDGKPFSLATVYHSGAQLTSLPKNYFAISNSIGPEEAADSAGNSKWTKLDAVFPAGCFVNLISKIEGSSDTTQANIGKEVIATMKGFVDWSFQNNVTKQFFNQSVIWFRISINWLKQQGFYEHTKWTLNEISSDIDYMPCTVTPKQYRVGAMYAVPACFTSTLEGNYLYIGFLKPTGSASYNYFEGFNFDLTMWLKRAN